MSDALPPLKFHARKLLGRMTPSIRLCGRHENTQECTDAGGTLFWLEPTGRRAGATSARALINGDYLVALNDGLLEGSQTWVRK